MYACRDDAEVKPVEMVVMSQRLKYELCVSDEKVVLHWQGTICCLCNIVCAPSSVCNRQVCANVIQSSTSRGTASLSNN